MPNIKKTLLHTFYYANNKITCIRCNLTGKFVSIKKWLATQKANAILANAQANKPRGNYLLLVIMMVFVVVAYALCYSTIKERQEYHNNWNNSNELMLHYYDSCTTDTECEALEAKLNFDFKKGMN